jgi:hypothetical protein
LHLPLLTLIPTKEPPNQRTIISTEAAHAFVSGAAEKSASLIEAPRSNSFHCVYDPWNLFFAFSAQKSHVKSKNHLNPTNQTRSQMKKTYSKTAILKTVEKTNKSTEGREVPQGLTPLFAKI